MDCIRSIQKAIEYMEDHMLEKIGYEDVAKQVYMSNYHFHRLFSMITGMTANEYIRNRRLSMAGQELASSDVKVIDTALKYGYESPESFAKAFSRFHGVTPTEAKRSGATMRLFNRLVIKIQLEGGMVMEYRIVEREGFTLLTKYQKFRNEITSETGNTEISEFWTQCREAGVLRELEELTGKQEFYGICGPISKEETHFDYGIGLEYNGDAKPEGFRIWEVKPALWAVFPCIGQDSGCIPEVWEKIYREFLPGSDYNMLDDVDFELYSDDLDPGCFCEIWIPVERK